MDEKGDNEIASDFQFSESFVNENQSIFNSTQYTYYEDDQEESKNLENQDILAEIKIGFDLNYQTKEQLPQFQSDVNLLNSVK